MRESGISPSPPAVRLDAFDDGPVSGRQVASHSAPTLTNVPASGDEEHERLLDLV